MRGISSMNNLMFIDATEKVYSGLKWLLDYKGEYFID